MLKNIFFVLSFFLLCTPAFAATSVPFTIAMSEAVNVTGSPRIAVDVGGVTRYADYASGTGTSSLTFTYAAQAGDVDLDGVTLSSPIDLNGGTITDLNGNPETDLTFTVPDTSGIKINYPSLSMDFIADADGRYTLNGTAYNDLPSFLSATGGTFARNSVGTYFDENGVMQTATANQPRFDHDPVTLQPKGILIEESRTNTIVYSQEIGNSGWLVSNSSISPTSFLAPDGTLSAKKIIDNTTNAKHYVRQSKSGNIVSIFAKAGEKNILRIDYQNLDAYQVHYNLSSGTIIGSWGADSSGIEDVGNGWYRCWAKWPNDASSVSFAILATNAYPSAYVGDGVSGLYLWGAQLEQGAFPTSYIPTTTAAVKRQADNLSMPIGSWYNSSGGSLSSSSISNGISSSSFPGVYDFYVTGSERYGLYYNINGTNMTATKRVGSTFAIGSGASVGGILIKSSAVYNNAGLRLKVNNFPLTTDSNVGFILGNPTLNIGKFDQALNGYIQNFKYYPLTVSDTQLQLMTQ